MSPRDRLPPPEDEDEFYHADLIGLRGSTADGEPLGTVAAVQDFGAGDIIEIAPADGGRPLMLPFTKPSCRRSTWPAARGDRAEGRADRPSHPEADASPAQPSQAPGCRASEVRCLAAERGMPDNPASTS